MALTSGTRLGPYEIQAPLGAGGMGEVYRARDTRLDREVAIKVLPANLSPDPSLKQRLEREAKAVSKLSHPHICTLHDIGHQDGVDFLVMEYLEGETLEQRLIKGPLSTDQTLCYAAQIADALARAHMLGITHRDLKPSNVMLTKSGAKLMDFGLAKQSGPAPLQAAVTAMTMAQSKLTGEGTIVGTFQYMAPEQLEGKEADARTDIFAFGEVIYEMATGRPAFTGKSRASLIAAILTSEPPPIAQLQPLSPPALERVVKKCLAKDPDGRWQSAADLASELNWILEGGSQAGIAAPVASKRKHRETMAWALAAVGLCVAAVVVGLYLRNSANPAGVVRSLDRTGRRYIPHTDRRLCGAAGAFTRREPSGLCGSALAGSSVLVGKTVERPSRPVVGGNGRRDLSVLVGRWPLTGLLRGRQAEDCARRRRHAFGGVCRSHRPGRELECGGNHSLFSGFPEHPDASPGFRRDAETRDGYGHNET
jgi:predicted Ser/Thr protein kinase